MEIGVLKYGLKQCQKDPGVRKGSSDAIEMLQMEVPSRP